MLHDAMQHWMIAAFEAQAYTFAPGAVAVKILEDIVDYHTTPEDAARAAQMAGAGELVLTHGAPPLPARLFYRPFWATRQTSSTAPLLSEKTG